MVEQGSNLTQGNPRAQVLPSLHGQPAHQSPALPHMPWATTVSRSPAQRSPAATLTHWTQSQYLVCDEGQPHALQLASRLAEDKVVFLGLGDDEMELDFLS